MQLIILLALLMFGGRADAKNLLSEVKPVLESLGGEDIQNALKNAEQISEVIKAVSSFSPAPAETHTETADAISFPLEPVSKIADRDITYSLSRYIFAN